MNSSFPIRKSRPNPEEEKQGIDPLSPERNPDEKTIDIAEGQKGISYKKLFLPYLKGAKAIKIFDPYIRLQYQRTINQKQRFFQYA